MGYSSLIFRVPQRHPCRPAEALPHLGAVDRLFVFSLSGCFMGSPNEHEGYASLIELAWASKDAYDWTSMLYLAIQVLPLMSTPRSTRRPMFVFIVDMFWDAKLRVDMGAPLSERWDDAFQGMRECPRKCPIG